MPSRTAAQQLWAVISTRVRAAVIRPSPTTPAVTGIALSARHKRASVGWLRASREVLPTAYFHVVFSVPHELNVLALENPRCFYNLLFAAASATLLEVAANPKRLGAEIGIIAILHTWGQNLLLHPHLHCVVPAGGLAPDHSRWLSVKPNFFLPIPVLRKVFRGKFVAGLKRLRQRGKLCRTGPAACFADPKQFAKLLRRLHLRRWVVYAKASIRRTYASTPLSGPLHASRRHFQSPLAGFRWRAG